MMRLSPIRCSRKRTSQSWLTAPKKFRMSASSIQFTFLILIAVESASNASCGPLSRSKPVGETAEVAFVDYVEQYDGCALDDFVFQGGDR